MTERGDMDTKDFDVRNEEKSRSVCERIHAEHAGRELSERERRILDMWPKFEDGAPLMYEDEFQLGGEAHTAYGFNFGVYGRVSIGVEQGSHVRLPNGERVKRPEPKVLDADGVEIKVGDTVWHEDGTMLRVDGFGGIEDGETIVNVHIIRGATPWRAVRSLSLTHTGPDSWEKLEEDMAKHPCVYAADVKGGEFSRCSECPWHSDCGGARASEVMARDIVRRAKALAGVEAAAGR